MRQNEFLCMSKQMLQGLFIAIFLLQNYIFQPDLVCYILTNSQFINSNLGTDIQFQLTMRKHELQDSINPHRFVQTPVKSTQKITQLYSKTTNNQTNQQKNFTQRQSHDKTQRVKITTEVLLDKILQLQVKIKTFQQQRKVSQLLNKSATQYQSINTQPVAVFGSIKRNDINKNFNTTVQNQQNNTSQTIFKQIAARSIINPEHKITNNIYNDNLTQNKKQNNVKQEIDLLKKKLSVLENGKGLSNKMVKNNTGPYNFQIFQNKPQEKLCSQSRRQLGGKIVKRLGSKLSQSPTNIIRAQTEQSQNINAKKGGIRRQDSVMQMSRYSNISNFGHQNKKKDSSAIFRKNLGPAVVYKRQSSTTHISKYKTTQQNSFHDKIIALESRYAQQMFKNSYTAPIFQKYNREFNIPNLNFTPSPNSTSDELINLGKQTFRKFGYQINQNVILNVKKFKNCVLFSINAEQNILWHYEGKFYYGGWKTYINGQGQKFGKGIQFVPGKYKYKGSFQEGKKSGYGILIEQSGSIYIGNWFDGLKHGKGKLIQLDGSQYHGDWKSGKKSGYGRLFYKGVLQFEGNFVGGMKHGFGKETFQNGDYYEGQYLGNKFQGKGTYIWSSKAMFVGQFRDGKRHGRGIWRSGQANYDEYEGEYQEDNKNGYGIYKWASGAIYKGGFKNDLKHGQGSITYENGNLVRMIWNKGKVEKTLMDSKRIEQAKHQYPAPRTKLRKSSSTRSNLNLPSTTSLKSQRSLPKGLSLKKQLAHINYTQPSPKFQFRKKLSPNELLKFKNRTSSRSGLLSKLSSHSVRDPPYKSMQTSPSVKLKR